MIDIQQILEDYAPDTSIWNDDDELVNKLKEIIYNKLTEPEKRIILMYAELGNLRKLGKELGVSTSSAWLKCREIKTKIIDELDELD